MMIGIDMKINPADHAKIPQWEKDFLWKPFSEDEVKENIKAIQKESVKSGSILFHNEDGTFQVITFRAKKINEAQPQEVAIRIKHARKNAPLTFDDKIDLLERFVAENGKEPGDEDVFEGFHVGTFYKSILKNRDKFQSVVDIVENNETEESTKEETKAPEPEPEKEEEEEIKEEKPTKKGKKNAAKKN